MNKLNSNSDPKAGNMEIFIGKWLRLGAYTATVIALIGGAVYLSQHTELPDYHVFQGVPYQYTNLPGIITGVLTFDGASIIQLAAVVLIATPILRIVFSVVAFAVEKDRMYVLITLIVLSIILFGMFSGLGG